jgi:hypothetical protein
VDLLYSYLFLSLTINSILQQNNKNFTIMTLLEIKKISVRQYLDNMGIQPEKERGYYGMYHCPFRKDQNASFKVDYDKNVWYDFGTDEGGSIIDLVMKMENCSFHEAAKRLECKCASMQINKQQNTMLRFSTPSPIFKKRWTF